VVTVGLEDYYQVGAFNRLIQRGQWYRFETRLDKSARRTLDLLDRFNVKATFFVLGWIADRFPEVVRLVAERGHEVASKGYYHRSIRQMTPEEFRDDLRRSREALERAAGRRVLGYRVAHEWFLPSDLWALDVLADEGYAYDSSINPLLRRYAHEPWRRFLHEHHSGTRRLWEFPISNVNVLGWNVPVAGGNYFRQFPHTLVKRAVAHWHRKYEAPFVMYFHVWELDPEQPKLNTNSLLTRIRHYRGLDKMHWVLEDYLSKYPFTSIADYLGLRPEPVGPPPAPAEPRHDDSAVRLAVGPPPADPSSDDGRTPVSIVVPCYNEELILPYLANTLKSVENALAHRYDLRFVFVDDGSADGTHQALEKLFGGNPRNKVLRHDPNQGVTAAILTGIRNADTEIVCSIDCDCTYDPHELARMIPLLTDGVDLVTASPYHPEGAVRNVPGWRLFLSKGSSFLYRRVLRQKLYTYTSCFRVYRRSAVLGLDVREKNFLGVAELLGKLDLLGSRIVEHPATLEVRMLGRSKMKTLRTILGHLMLLSRLAMLRLWRGGSGAGNHPPHAPAMAGTTPPRLLQEAERTSS
jgi:polysaccharide deacetylase family protein (PEP-CTERM system associated)